MAKNAKSTRKINVAPATVPATSVLGAQAAAQAASGRSNVAKPVTAKPVDATAVTVPRGIPLIDRRTVSDTAYLARAKYPVSDTLSATDAAYLGLFATFCKADSSGVANVAAIDASGARPVGIDILNNRARLHRLHGAGYAEYVSADKIRFSLTAKAKTRAEYTTATARKLAS